MSRAEALKVLKALNKDKPHGMDPKMYADYVEHGFSRGITPPVEAGKVKRGRGRPRKIQPKGGVDLKPEFGTDPQLPLAPIQNLPYEGKMQNIGSSVMQADPDTINSISTEDLLRETKKFLSRVGVSGFTLDQDPVDPLDALERAQPVSKTKLKNEKVGRRKHKPVIPSPADPIVAPAPGNKEVGLSIKDLEDGGFKVDGKKVSSKVHPMGAGLRKKAKGGIPVAGSKKKRTVTPESIAAGKAGLKEWTQFMDSIRDSPFIAKIKGGRDKQKAGSQYRELVMDAGSVGYAEDEIYDEMVKLADKSRELSLKQVEEFMDALRKKIRHVEHDMPLTSQKRLAQNRKAKKKAKSAQ